MTAGERAITAADCFQFDLSKKPAYDMIHHLFSERWITNTESRNKQQRNRKIQRFYGDYEITVDGKKFDISVIATARKISLIYSFNCIITEIGLTFFPSIC